MTIDEAINLIQADIKDPSVDWDSELGKAYKLSFEALKRVKLVRESPTGYWEYRLSGETEK